MFFGVSVKINVLNMKLECIQSLGHGEVTAAQDDDELCIDRLHLFTLLFLNYTSSVVKINDALLRKTEIQFCFRFCCEDLRVDHYFINWSQQFLQHTDSSRRFQM